MTLDGTLEIKLVCDDRTNLRQDEPIASSLLLEVDSHARHLCVTTGRRQCGNGKQHFK